MPECSGETTERMADYPRMGSRSTFILPSACQARAEHKLEGAQEC